MRKGREKETRGKRAKRPRMSQEKMQEHEAEMAGSYKKEKLEEAGRNVSWGLPESVSIQNQYPTDPRKSDCFLFPTVQLPL